MEEIIEPRPHRSPTPARFNIEHRGKGGMQKLLQGFEYLFHLLSRLVFCVLPLVRELDVAVVLLVLVSTHAEAPRR